MRIIVKDKHHTKLSLWLPTSNFALGVALKHFVVDGKKLSPEKRRRLLKEFRHLRKFHKPLIDIEIIEKNGTYVLIKI